MKEELIMQGTQNGMTPNAIFNIIQKAWGFQPYETDKHGLRINGSLQKPMIAFSTIDQDGDVKFQLKCASCGSIISGTLTSFIRSYADSGCYCSNCLGAYNPRTVINVGLKSTAPIIPREDIISALESKNHTVRDSETEDDPTFVVTSCNNCNTTFIGHYGNIIDRECAECVRVKSEHNGASPTFVQFYYILLKSKLIHRLGFEWGRDQIDNMLGMDIPAPHVCKDDHSHVVMLKPIDIIKKLSATGDDKVIACHCVNSSNNMIHEMCERYKVADSEILTLGSVEDMFKGDDEIDVDVVNPRDKKFIEDDNIDIIETEDLSEADMNNFPANDKGEIVFDCDADTPVESEDITPTEVSASEEQMVDTDEVKSDVIEELEITGADDIFLERQLPDDAIPVSPVIKDKDVETAAERVEEVESSSNEVIGSSFDEYLDDSGTRAEVESSSLKNIEEYHALHDSRDTSDEEDGDVEPNYEDFEKTEEELPVEVIEEKLIEGIDKASPESDDILGVSQGMPVVEDEAEDDTKVESSVVADNVKEMQDALHSEKPIKFPTIANTESESFADKLLTGDEVLEVIEKNIHQIVQNKNARMVVAASAPIADDEFETMGIESDDFDTPEDQSSDDSFNDVTPVVEDVQDETQRTECESVTTQVSQHYHSDKHLEVFDNKQIEDEFETMGEICDDQF